MLMLKKLDWCPYWTIASMDSPQRGASETDKVVNVQEAASILDAFESLYSEAVKSLKVKGIEGFDLEVATSALKPCFQKMRHGLAFDWVINSAVARLIEYYPFSSHVEYSGTAGFLQQFEQDAVFIQELEELHIEVDNVINWLFEDYPDRSVYKLMAALSGETTLSSAYQYIRDNPPVDPLIIPESTGERIIYAVLFMEMLTLGVGHFNRIVWTNRFNAISTKEEDHKDFALVVGGKFSAFVYGDLDGTGAKWKRLVSGIKPHGINTRVDRTDIVRPFPDEMTFFWFTDDALIIDESKNPMVQLVDESGNVTEWIDPRTFMTYAGLHLDKTFKLRVKYDFPQDPNHVKTIKIKGSQSVIVKDKEVHLDASGVGETQIVFRANRISFKVSDTEKQYPFTMFSNTQIEHPTDFPWLTE